MFTRTITINQRWLYVKLIKIAITEFEGLCGFRPFTEIIQNIKDFPELNILIGGVSNLPSDNKSALKQIFNNLMSCTQDQINTAIDKTIIQLKGNHEKGSPQELFVRLNTQFPNDVGVFCQLFLNCHSKIMSII